MDGNLVAYEQYYPEDKKMKPHFGQSDAAMNKLAGQNRFPNAGKGLEQIAELEAKAKEAGFETPLEYLKAKHEEAAGMPLESMFMGHLDKPIETQDLIRQMQNKRKGRKVEKPFNMPRTEEGKKGGFNPQSDYARIFEIAKEMQAEIKMLHEAIEASENEKKQLRRDAQELSGELQDLIELCQQNGLHVTSIKCWCNPKIDKKEQR